MRYFNTQKISRKGFTLMEILVVMAIGLSLMSIVMFSISSARQKSRDGKRIADISQLRLSLEQFYDSCGQYPNTLALDEGAQSGEDYCPGTTQFSNFLAQIPTDPTTGSGYYYYAVGSGTDCYKYHIGATLENSSHSELGNDNDITSTPGAACTGGGTFVSGADGSVYDFVPTL